MIYRGSCHCGTVAYEVEAEFDSALSCNCSICARKAPLLAAVPHASLRVTTPEAGKAYTFNKHQIVHRFCPTCGIHPYGEDAAEGPERSAYVNLRCLEDFDPAVLPLIEFDGRNAL
ncbi:MAG: GFA family protein [Rhizobiaceae bacterium]|nr:GFA family protein [Rhizobiaceae bacterium]MCV0408583.1 GFA family protein [Rhizobiaceae bacterium]